MRFLVTMVMFCALPKSDKAPYRLATLNTLTDLFVETHCRAQTRRVPEALRHGCGAIGRTLVRQYECINVPPSTSASIDGCATVGNKTLTNLALLATTALFNPRSTTRACGFETTCIHTYIHTYILYSFLATSTCLVPWTTSIASSGRRFTWRRDCDVCRETSSRTPPRSTGNEDPSDRRRRTRP